MEAASAIPALSALAHPIRLDVFRLLVRAGEGGVAAGAIARRLNVLPNTLSANLNILSGAGLVRARREGRSLLYSADFGRMSDLLGFLMKDCCADDPAICAPVLDNGRRTCG